MNIFSIFNKKSSRRKNRGQGEGFKGLIAASDLKSPATEAYRVLRTNIHYATSEDEQRTLLFTSAGPGEGKSATSANTAVVLAQGGKKVVVIDCDLRKPTQHVLFGVERTIGITNVLVENWSVDDVIKKTEVPNVSIIPSGPLPPNPAELLGTTKFVKMLESLKERFDVIVIDSPPNIAVTDANIIASRVDGVVLVCNTETVKPEMAKKSKGLLQNAKANILGVVLNRMAVHGDDYYYYYYYYGQSDKA